APAIRAADPLGVALDKRDLVRAWGDRLGLGSCGSKPVAEGGEVVVPIHLNYWHPDERATRITVFRAIVGVAVALSGLVVAASMFLLALGASVERHLWSLPLAFASIAAAGISIVAGRWI